jgi:hypothetical protein
MPPSQGSKPGLSPVPSKPSTPQPSAGRPKPQSAQTTQPAQAPKPPPMQHAATTGPGKGPKTFDEMGIGQAPGEKDCVSHSSSHTCDSSLTRRRLSCR